MRILLDIVAAVRMAMGPGKLLSVKVNCQDFRAGGFKESEALELLAELAKASVDLVEVSGGTYEHMACMGQSDQDREGTFLDFAREVRQRVPGLPVMATGGFRSLSFCSEAVTSGGCDVVGLCRPLCLQPNLPHRWLHGEALDAASYRVRLFLAPAPAAAPGKRQARRAHPSARSPEAPLLSAGACLHLRATPALDQQLRWFGCCGCLAAGYWSVGAPTLGRLALPVSLPRLCR